MALGAWWRGRERRRAAVAAQAVDDLYRSLLLHSEPEALHASALARLAEIAATPRIALLLADGTGAARTAAWHGAWPQAAAAARFGPRGLLRWLEVNQRPLLVDEQRQVVDDLPPEERELLRGCGVTLVVPLAAAGRPTGLLLLGAAAPGAPGPQRRAALLAGLAVPTALAFEHATLVREQAARVRQLYRAERLATAGTLAAGLAHEIRNPLTAIRTGMQVVRDRADTAPEVAEVLGDLLHEVDRINRLVEGLLLLTRAPRRAAGAVDLADLARRAAALLERRAAGVGVAVVLDAPRPVWIEADAGQIEQVVVNLLLNALEAPPARTIEVRVLADRGRARLEVADDGPGLPPELGERVLEPFVTSKPEGSGLGLAITESIVRHHGGELGLADRAGGGARATVVLPLGEAPCAS